MSRSLIYFILDTLFSLNKNAVVSWMEELKEDYICPNCQGK